MKKLIFLLFLLPFVSYAETTVHVTTNDGVFISVSDTGQSLKTVIDTDRYITVNLQGSTLFVSSGPASGGVVGHTVYSSNIQSLATETYQVELTTVHGQYTATNYYPLTVSAYVDTPPPEVPLNTDGTLDRDGDPETSGDDELNEDGTVDGDGDPETSGDDELEKIDLEIEFPAWQALKDKYNITLAFASPDDFAFSKNIMGHDLTFEGLKQYPAVDNIIQAFRNFMKLLVSLFFVYLIVKTVSRF